MKQRIAWGTLLVIACAAVYFITESTAQLPGMVASHFDAGGFPTAFVPRTRYSHVLLTLGIGVPLVLVALLTAVYSRATDMKLPNRDYWLAPERIGQTRDLLVAHGIWFGTLLISMTCFVHGLELIANRSMPAHLPNNLVYAGLLIFFVIAVGWIAALLLAFRRPRGA
jgi:uncharacterized membrane protein